MTTRPSRPVFSLLRRTARALFPYAVVFTSAASIASGGCNNEGGTETGNPSFEAKLSYTAYASNPSVVSVRDPAAGGAVVNAVWLVLGNVGFYHCSAGSDGPQAPGLGVGNHASGKPVTTPFEMNAGDYCRVELLFVHADRTELPAEAPETLKDNDIVLEGVSPSGVPFTVLSASPFPVHMSAADLALGFEVNRAESQLLMGFDVSVWLGEVDWASATVTDGKIVISGAQNADLLTQFERNLAAGVNVFRDADGDGALDPDAELVAAGAPD